jgi:hypothetical protein
MKMKSRACFLQMKTFLIYALTFTCELVATFSQFLLQVEKVSLKDLGSHFRLSYFESHERDCIHVAKMPKLKHVAGDNVPVCVKDTCLHQCRSSNS